MKVFVIEYGNVDMVDETLDGIYANKKLAHAAAVKAAEEARDGMGDEDYVVEQTKDLVSVVAYDEPCDWWRITEKKVIEK